MIASHVTHSFERALRMHVAKILKIKTRREAVMSMEQEGERLRRQKVLKELNSRLTAGSKVDLSITGRGIALQGMLL